jgi:aconitate hydratase
MQYLNQQAVKKMYEALPDSHEVARKVFSRPLTLTEKILWSHLAYCWKTPPIRGQSYVMFNPDRVAMQDATAQMALLQFMQAELKEVAVPTTVHCDHLIQARVGADADLLQAINDNQEVYDFLRTASNKHGIGFWGPGSGIIHQVVLEKYAYPGAMMIGTDSHTPNAGGLGMLAIGVGGADAVDVMAGLPWGVTWPKLIGVKLTGKLNGWTSAKDVILKLAGILTVAGGTGAIVEYFGPGTKSISCTGKATITNMGAELGATTSVFPYDDHMYRYLKATGREIIAEEANKYSIHLTADPEIENDPQKYFDRLIEIDLDKLEPYIVGPHTPDLARPVSQLPNDVKDKSYPEKLRYALIGSCTNSSYEDMSRAAHIARQAKEKGLKVKCGFLITPGSEQIHKTIERDGQLAALESIGGTVLANACGPCIGQWKREDITPGETNSIITSFNRNFQKRNDGNAQTLAFIGSPEIVTAYALAGSLNFDPCKDTLETESGVKVKLEPPTANDLPAKGFTSDNSGYIAPIQNGQSVDVIVKPESERLQLLAPFLAWNGSDFVDLPVLVKAFGKCTTDHISPAGAWLRYRGHLDKISDNMFSGAVNAFTRTAGTGINVLTGKTDSFQQVARHYKAQNIDWVVVGDENYGEGSSREHAAMSPRYLGCKAVIVKSFARIHETNLKKQGILALTFVDPRDYDKIEEYDRISIVGLNGLAPDKFVDVIFKHKDGSTHSIVTKHTMTPEQIDWFKAGSALNLIKQQSESK